ncbi:conserved membrane hypothetical protein [Vibrio crassostreae]|nr:conserved membrane hypothetical protein [Vibrio crassostreae]
MENTLIALISILIGVATTFIASRHYYRRSVDKELTPFVHMQSNVLSRIDKEVKSDLHIEYKGVKVENLQQVQFLIANTGERAIRDLIKPLTLNLPSNVEIMDASIIYVSPEGRDVFLEASENGHSVKFEFPLLNKDELFIFKLLLKGAPKLNELEFTIVADDLPPNLDIQRLTYNQIEKEDKSKRGKSFELGLFLISIVVLFLAFSMGILAHYINTESFPVIQYEGWGWINLIPFLSIASFVGYAFSGMLCLIGGMTMAGSIFGDFEFPKSKKFKLPKEFATTNYSFRGLHEVVVMDEMTASKAFKSDS